MKAIDIILRILGTATFIVGLGMPGKFASMLGSFTAIAAGMWGILYPQGILGWAKSARPEINPTDESQWIFCKIAGSMLVLVGLVIAISVARSQ